MQTLSLDLDRSGSNLQPQNNNNKKFQSEPGGPTAGARISWQPGAGPRETLPGHSQNWASTSGSRQGESHAEHPEVKLNLTALLYKYESGLEYLYQKMSARSLSPVLADCGTPGQASEPAPPY